MMRVHFVLIENAAFVSAGKYMCLIILQRTPRIETSLIYFFFLGFFFLTPPPAGPVATGTVPDGNAPLVVSGSCFAAAGAGAGEEVVARGSALAAATGRLFIIFCISE